MFLCMAAKAARAARAAVGDMAVREEKVAMAAMVEMEVAQ